MSTHEYTLAHSTRGPHWCCSLCDCLPACWHVCLSVWVGVWVSWVFASLSNFLPCVCVCVSMCVCVCPCVCPCVCCARQVCGLWAMCCLVHPDMTSPISVWPAGSRLTQHLHTLLSDSSCLMGGHSLQLHHILLVHLARDTFQRIFLSS